MNAVDNRRCIACTQRVKEAAVALFTRNPFRRRRSRRRKLAPVEEIVEQGLLVADVAVRMTVKNDIIMNALHLHSDYDKAEIVEMVREAIIEVAEEREHDAEHIRRVRDEIKLRGYSSWIDSDYRNSDDRTLRHREAVYDGVASHLHERAGDEQYLDQTAERARKAAWREIGDSLKVRASEPYYGGGHLPEYGQQREARIEAFIAEDLAELLKSVDRPADTASVTDADPAAAS